MNRYELGQAIRLTYQGCVRVLPFEIDAHGCMIYMGKRKGKAVKYPTVTIHAQIYMIHRLMLVAKLEREIRAGYWACHSCDNAYCINPEHLSECTPAENLQDSLMRSGRRQVPPKPTKGSLNHNSKLTESDIPKIRKLLDQGTSQRAIAAQFNVSPSLIGLIKNNQIWRHVREMLESHDND
ncbi:MAG: helix-turn-helix domain-containing protein [Oscillatoriophycideae cyanobacterium NC_groundwater_1537_Pr4_S-0.65um_50_18]|nr:helix-turn-helix domain-containing protein [Oscillatoriophycideae cyanobacterium NC_groundwater_1537_Pr4_S-0.65um_50_18]